MWVNRGFTLIELVMVIVVTGILAAVVGPRFFDRTVFDERMFFEESIGAVRYAQKLALASGCLTQVSLDNSGYRVQQAASCTSGAFTLAVIGADGQSPYSNARPSNVVIKDPVGFPVVFDSLGRPGAAASVTVGGFAFRVEADTGLVVTP
jgi:MSHA pilin protein MshC